MSENHIHQIINIEDALSKTSRTEVPRVITPANDPALDKGLITSKGGEQVLLGSEAAETALKGLTNAISPQPAALPELTSTERRALLAGQPVISRAAVPADRRYGSEDVGGVPTTTPGPRQVRIETEEGIAFKRPVISTVGTPGEAVPIERTTSEDRQTYLDRLLNRREK